MVDSLRTGRVRSTGIRLGTAEVLVREGEDDIDGSRCGVPALAAVQLDPIPHSDHPPPRRLTGRSLLLTLRRCHSTRCSTNNAGAQLFSSIHVRTCSLLSIITSTASPVTHLHSSAPLPIDYPPFSFLITPPIQSSHYGLPFLPRPVPKDTWLLI